MGRDLFLASGQLCSNPLLGDRYSKSVFRPLAAQAAEGQNHRNIAHGSISPAVKSSRSLGRGQSHKSHTGSREFLSAHGRCVLIVYAERIYGAPIMHQALKIWQQSTKPSPVL